MTQELKALIGIFIVTVGIIIGAAVFMGKPMESSQNAAKADAKLLLREGAGSVGNPKAKLTIVEFGDYQCPACGLAHPIVKDVLAAHGKDIYFVFRNFPLSMHKNASLAAKSAEAAKTLGKFWEMHDMLYETQAEWGESGDALTTFVGFAKELSLDEEAFKKALDSDAIAAIVSKDQADGGALSVNSTPTFYINGEKIDNFNNLRTEVENRLKK